MHDRFSRGHGLLLLSSFVPERVKDIRCTMKRAYLCDPQKPIPKSTLKRLAKSPWAAEESTSCSTETTDTKPNSKRRRRYLLDPAYAVPRQTTWYSRKKHDDNHLESSNTIDGTVRLGGGDDDHDPRNSSSESLGSLGGGDDDHDPHNSSSGSLGSLRGGDDDHDPHNSSSGSLGSLGDDHDSLHPSLATSFSLG